jgi:acetyl-CoA synthetase (ADP-forming)
VSDESRAALREAGIGLIEDSERVFDIVRRVLEPRAADTSVAHHGEADAAKPRLMGELEALDTLRAAGLPMLETLTVNDPAGLKAVADRLGYPLVLKGLVPDVGHKSGLGLVKLDLHGWSSLSAAYEDVRAKIAAYPGASVVVQPAARGGLAELLLGVVSDPEFGKHVTLGMGGVFTDFLSERAWAKAPVNREEASRMLDQLAIAPGLRGARKGVRACADGVIDALVSLSHWAVENDASVEEVEINPLIVRRDDVVGVDALIALRSAPETAKAASVPAEAQA